MKKILNATRNDKARIIDILCSSFFQDPQINWMLGKEKNKDIRLRQLMSYAFEQGMVNGKIDLTEDKNAVAIWRNHHSNKLTWKLMVESIRFSIVFGFGRLKRIKKMELKIAKNYPSGKAFEYLWFIGTIPEKQGNGYGSLLLNSVLAESKQQGKEVYLETSTDSNVNFYKNKGFKTYGSVDLSDSDKIKIHLLKTS